MKRDDDLVLRLGFDLAFGVDGEIGVGGGVGSGEGGLDVLGWPPGRTIWLKSKRRTPARAK